MLKRILLTAFAAALISIGYITPAHTDKPSSSRKAPDFSLPDLKGQKYTLGALKGKVALIDLWATWCPPCKKSIPELAKLQKKYDGQLQIIGIAYDDAVEDVTEFLNKNEIGKQINYPIVFGPPLPQYFGEVEALPKTVLIDKKGNIRMEKIGLIPYEELDSALTKLVAE